MPLMTLQLSHVYSQETRRYAGGGGFSAGYGNMDVSDLQVFAPAGIKKFKNDHLLLGGTGHAHLGNFVIGGSGMGMIGDGEMTDSLEVSLGGGLGTFDIGYLVVNRDHVKCYPMIGLGAGGYGISIAQNENVSASDVVNNPGREINISHGGFVIDASLNLDFIPFLQYDEEENSYGGFMTGLKVGYLLGFPTSDWTFAGGDVTGGPDFGLNMIYVKLNLGGFGQDAEKSAE